MEALIDVPILNFEFCVDGNRCAIAKFFEPEQIWSYSQSIGVLSAPDTSLTEHFAYFDRNENMFGGIGVTLYAINPDDQGGVTSLLWEAQDQDLDYAHRIRPCGFIEWAGDLPKGIDERGIRASIFIYGYTKLAIERFGIEWFDDCHLRGSQGGPNLETSYQSALKDEYSFVLDDRDRIDITPENSLAEKPG
ncbi:hypothetical protein XMV225_000815 [Aliiroseovarius sp. xm-v-225]|nr:hypothetical protein [Aliiroseovarius sp. xm-m-378]NRP64530.1 hypothetical protein [Aliiroseovarius sp. xm-v-225]NRP91591.1 hypothetical protein [Aliiroseovarius sp. xm-a-134]